MITIRYKNVEVQMQVEFDADGYGTVMFYNPQTYTFVQMPRNITDNWSFRDSEDNEAMETIIDYLENMDWDLFLQDVENGDIYELIMTPDSGITINKVEKKETADFTVKVKRSTAKRLKEKGTAGDSMDSVITKLLDFYEDNQK